MTKPDQWRELDEWLDAEDDPDDLWGVPYSAVLFFPAVILLGIIILGGFYLALGHIMAIL